MMQHPFNNYSGLSGNFNPGQEGFPHSTTSTSTPLFINDTCFNNVVSSSNNRIEEDYCFYTSSPPPSWDYLDDLFQLQDFQNLVFPQQDELVLNPIGEEEEVITAGTTSIAHPAVSAQLDKIMDVNDEDQIIVPSPTRIIIKKPSSCSSKKDRHSKIHTAHGPRDRRMRLSLDVARKFFDLQDLLGFDKASKTVDWLLSKSQCAITELQASMRSSTTSSCAVVVGDENNAAANSSLSSITTSECEVVSGTTAAAADNDSSATTTINENPDDKKINNNNKKKGSASDVKKNARVIRAVLGKESREKARERARERTLEKKKLIKSSSSLGAGAAGSWNNNINSSSVETAAAGDQESGTTTNSNTQQEQHLSYEQEPRRTTSQESDHYNIIFDDSLVGTSAAAISNYFHHAGVQFGDYHHQF